MEKMAKKRKMTKQTNREKSVKLNNAGLSLVELLISVTILAVIVIPLLHMFVTSSNINVKSRKTLRATTVAQDIMEGLKAYDIEELKTQFNNPAEGFYVISDNMIQGGVAEDISRETTEVGTDAEGNPNPGYYCFTMRDITMQGSQYDALIIVDARGYGNSGSHTSNQQNVDAHGNPQAHNNSGFAAVTAISDSNKGGEDGVYAEKAAFTEQVLTEIRKAYKDDFEADGLVVADVTFKTPGLKVIRRTYQVDISDGGTDADGNKIADVEITVEYECDYKGNAKTIYGLDHIPYASFTADSLGGNFYFMYYPLYEAEKEEIVIDNAAGIPLNLTIAKQIYASADPDDPYVLSDAQLNAAERSYRVQVNVEGGSLDKLKLRTNLGTNLTNKKYLEGEGETVDLPSQVDLQFNGTPTNQMNVFSLSGVRNTSLGAAGTGGEITEVIYDVRVEIYKAGAADKDFPQEDRMVSIDGSKNN